MSERSGTELAALCATGRDRAAVYGAQLTELAAIAPAPWWGAVIPGAPLAALAVMFKNDVLACEVVQRRLTLAAETLATALEADRALCAQLGEDPVPASVVQVVTDHAQALDLLATGVEELRARILTSVNAQAGDYATPARLAAEGAGWLEDLKERVLDPLQPTLTLLKWLPWILLGGGLLFLALLFWAGLPQAYGRRLAGGGTA